MTFILGKKIGMSQIFGDGGKVISVTAIEAGTVFITQVKNIEKDGYESVQIGGGTSKRVNKPMSGHLKRANWSDAKLKPRWIKEFRAKSDEYKIGDSYDITVFSEGDKIKVSGTSKGKGFQGVVKRHGFAGAPASHGHKGVTRKPGSIGSRFPQHVRKGKRMAGRMGGVRKTIRGLKVVLVDKENNLLLIKGAIPGNRGGLVEIKKD